MMPWTEKAKRESGVLALSRISEHMINMLSAHWHHLRQTVKSFCVRIWQRPLLLSAGMMWNYVRYVWRREWSSWVHLMRPFRKWRKILSGVMERDTASAKARRKWIRCSGRRSWNMFFHSWKIIEGILWKNIMILSKRHFRSTTDMEIRLWFLRKLSLEIWCIWWNGEGFRFQQRRVWNLNDTEKPEMSWHIWIF